MGLRKKKYASGEAKQYISRRQALWKLQLNLNDFRRVCILKGIYPREPRNRRRAQKGSTAIKTLYHMKDIQFLMHEPIIQKIREGTVFYKKVGRAKGIQEYGEMKRYLDKHPTLQLDHIVKERYPTFLDALRDLDDCLTLCFLFSTFPAIKHIPRTHTAMCRRLTVEFMHAIIEAKALRKVFISIKGYYYQAEIKGQTVTWITPHHFCYEPQHRRDVDFKVMSTFVEFYSVLLGFVNYRLYHHLNLHYPPQFAHAEFDQTESDLVDEDSLVSERVAALNHTISKSSNNIEEDVTFDTFEDGAEVKEDLESLKRLKTLFKGLKFYVNREVPREPLVFIIRCFGGEVSWDKTLFAGSTFSEQDESITHQIVDRPKIETQFISRYYIQPQWVFDSVNQRNLLPVNKYFIGCPLPPHLSPFVDKDRTSTYIPPEEKALYDPDLLEKIYQKDKDVEDGIEKDDSDEEEAKEEENSDEEGEEEEEDEEDEADETQPKLSVKPGEIVKEVPWKAKEEARIENKLKETMVKSKHRNLYKSMMEGKRARAKEIWLLRKKRRLHEEKNKLDRMTKGKAAKQQKKDKTGKKLKKGKKVAEATA